jgi:hypothetical protein
MADQKFFIGRAIDPATGKPTAEPINYDPADLTTHGIITGMTGSGKTGLGVAFLEEAALEGIPAIVIDPKGDMTNLLMHFPELSPADFAPWIDPEAARREGKSTAELAAETAQRWREGLAGWGLGREQLLALQQAAGFTIYTPGSSAGVPVNILASLTAPGMDWAANREILRERIATIVTALLTLVGVNVTDPLRSREHILLSNILEHAWSKNRSLDLHQLIVETSTPPFDRLGVLALDSVYPERDRFALAMLLNNFLASPTFASWIEGQTLDIGAMLFMPDGRPRHNVFYLAHLSDQERMFFVTLLFAAVESWMRSQRGTGHLRLLVYFDEIMGYMPPVANPPSRPVMLRMLKQARAFGVGLLLATQNPVDVDYKALSNAGTWVIGRLQTEQDKDRLMDGLRSASGALDVASIANTISGLGKRMFLLHSVHRAKPALFTTRWVLNYLAGPVTRDQIADLNQLAGSAAVAAGGPQSGLANGAAGGATRASGFVQAVMAATPPPSVLPGFSVQPAAVAGVDQVFLPASIPAERAVATTRLSGSWQAQGLLYRPTVFAAAEVRYMQRKYDVDHVQHVRVLATDLKPGRADWGEPKGLASVELGSQREPDARYDTLPDWLDDAKSIAALRKDFADWVYRNAVLRLPVNESLKVYGPAGISPEAFTSRCREAVRQAAAAEREKITSATERKIASLEGRRERLSLTVNRLRADVNARRAEELGAGLQTVIGMLSGRRSSISSNMSKRRMMSQAQARLSQEESKLAELDREASGLRDDQARQLRDLDDRWLSVAGQVTEIPIQPKRSDIYVDTFAVAWLPHHIIAVGSEHIVLPAFPAG